MTGTSHDVVHPATTASFVVNVSGMTPEAPSRPTATAPTIETARGERDRVQSAAVRRHLVGHHEVAGRADGRGQAPADADELMCAPANDIEDQHDPGDGKRDARQA